MKSLTTFSIAFRLLLPATAAAPTKAEILLPIAFFTLIDRIRGFTGVPPAVAAVYGRDCAVTQPGTRNDFVDKLPCKALTLIFARGTTESGNLGSIVGPPFAFALENLFSSGWECDGAQNMAQLIAQTMTQCPQTKLCVSGYSQGVQVVHLAANMLTQAQTNFISFVVIFGDPDDGEAIGSVPASKVSIDCHLDDDIYLHGDLILAPHLDYCLDASGEASFVVQHARL